MQPYFFLAFYAFRSKVLVLVIVNKIQDPEKFIPDPGGKKAPDPDLQHWFLLLTSYLKWVPVPVEAEVAPNFFLFFIHGT
jgi:hypothetical protein